MIVNKDGLISCSEFVKGLVSFGIAEQDKFMREKLIKQKKEEELSKLQKTKREEELIARYLMLI
jgi:hypothetical protein